MSASDTRPAVRWKGPVLLSAMLASGSVGLLIAFLTTPEARGNPVAADDSGAASPAGIRPASGRSVPAARRPPPRLQVPHEVEPPPVQLVPGQPGYDPTRFTAFVPLRSVFGQEPRDPAWADAVERALPGVVLRDVERLVPGLKIVEIVCRTSTCRLEWKAPPESEKRAAEVMRFLMPGSVSETRAPYHYFALSGGEWVFKDLPPGNANRTLEVAATARQKVLEQARAQGTPTLAAAIPSDAWPRP
jgi:hypothetical protein